MAVLMQMPTRHADTDTMETESFYALNDAARLALLPPSTLSHWVALGVATPSRRVVDSDNRIVAQGFTFSDLGYLHLLRHLRKSGVPLEDGVRFLVSMMERFGAPGPKWKAARVFVDGKRVFMYLPDDYETTLAKPGRGSQRVIDTFFGEAFIQLRDRADSVLIPPQLLDDIEINPRISDGMPVIAGTRIKTSVVRELAQTLPVKKISAMYPFLRTEQIDAAIEYEEILDKRAA